MFLIKNAFVDKKALYLSKCTVKQQLKKVKYSVCSIHRLMMASYVCSQLNKIFIAYYIEGMLCGQYSEGIKSCSMKDR